MFAVNIIISPVRLRKDVTEDKLYTLSNGKNVISLDLSKLSKGNYFINMTTEKGSHSDTLMVK